MLSERLRYEPLSDTTLEDFHRLVVDDHVRRYLMDGQVFPREWSEEQVRRSIDLFERRGVGLWLARDGETGEVAGFCGFLEIPVLSALGGERRRHRAGVDWRELLDGPEQ